MGKTRAEGGFESKKEKDLQEAKKTAKEDEQWKYKINQWITNLFCYIYFILNV